MRSRLSRTGGKGEGLVDQRWPEGPNADHDAARDRYNADMRASRAAILEVSRVELPIAHVGLLLVVLAGVFVSVVWSLRTGVIIMGAFAALFVVALAVALLAGRRGGGLGRGAPPGRLGVRIRHSRSCEQARRRPRLYSSEVQQPQRPDLSFGSRTEPMHVPIRPSVADPHRATDSEGGRAPTVPDRAGNHGEPWAVTVTGHESGPRPDAQVRGRSHCFQCGGDGIWTHGYIAATTVLKIVDRRTPHTGFSLPSA